jgi:hypothetical protein
MVNSCQLDSRSRADTSFPFKFLFAWLTFFVVIGLLVAATIVCRRTYLQYAAAAKLVDEYGNEPWISIEFDRDSVPINSPALFDHLTSSVVTVAGATLDDSDEQLKPLQQFPKLVNVVLDSSDISDEGIETLIRCRSLRTLELRGCNSITDDGFLRLIECDQLRKLTVFNLRVSDECIHQLESLRPDIQVVRE